MDETALFELGQMWRLWGEQVLETYPSGRIIQTGYNGGDRIAGVQTQSGTTYASAMSYAPRRGDLDDVG